MIGFLDIAIKLKESDGDPSRVIAEMSIISDYKKDITEENNLTIDNVESTTILTDNNYNVIMEWLNKEGVPSQITTKVDKSGFNGAQAGWLLHIFKKSFIDGNNASGLNTLKSNIPVSNFKYDNLEDHYKLYLYFANSPSDETLLIFKDDVCRDQDNSKCKRLEEFKSDYYIPRSHAIKVAGDGNCGYHSLIYPMLRHHILGDIDSFRRMCTAEFEESKEDTYPDIYKNAGTRNPFLHILDEIKKYPNDEDIELRSLLQKRGNNWNNENLEESCIEYLRKYTARNCFKKTYTDEGKTIDDFKKDKWVVDVENDIEKKESVSDIWNRNFIQMTRSVSPDELVVLKKFFNLPIGIIYIGTERKGVDVFRPEKDGADHYNTIRAAHDARCNIFAFFSGGHYDMYYIENN